MIRDIAIKQTQDFGIYEIQTSGLAPGIYQLRISNEGSAFATSFIVK
jgi:hypothetical protein